ncbi:MFS multidrug transporter [Tothia fuscella]|uniref:MFS multidrug transporter n=1 Tax=Tothia fuscella TaxID=1048955 RepID=A0A9P4NMV7_9PEZI|nr:MFS multidrug transporter [Tothia fuscella]
MANARKAPTETSPLLSKNGPGPQSPTRSVDPAANNSPGAVGPEASPLSHDESLEEQNSAACNGESDVQFEGMPEVKRQMIYLFPALGIGVLLAAADMTIIVSSYGKIGSELDALNSTSWIATAYFLTMTSFQPLYGKLSDIFGRKLCLLFAYVIFGLGCLFCGLAQDMNQLILSRAFAGIGGGGMTTVVSILLSDIVSLRERGKWQGYINIIYATGAGIGAPLGGVLADSIGWRFAFYGQAPLCLLAFITVGLVLKLPKQDNIHWKEKLHRIDFLGAVALLLSVVSLLIGLDRGSNVSWSDKYTVIAMCTSVPLIIIFILIELYVAAEPFAPGHIIFERTLFAAYLCNFFAFAGWLAAIFYVSLYFQAVYDLSATQAGIRLIPSIICGVSGSLASGFYMQKTGRYYWITVICYSTLVLGMLDIILFSGLAVSYVPGVIFGTMICAFSNGTGVTTSLIALISNAAREDQAIATACSYLFRSLGSAMGVSLCATAANQALRANLRAKLGNGDDADRIAEKVRQSLEFIKTLEPEMRSIVRDCYAQGTRAAFGVGIVLVAGSAVSAWFIKEKRLGR